MRLFLRAFIIVQFVAAPLTATIFGTVRGTVLDAQERAVAGARVELASRTSDWHQTTYSDSAGAFVFQAVPIGAYMLHAEFAGNAPRQQRIDVSSGAVVSATVTLQVASASGTVEVTASAPLVDPRSSTTASTISRVDVQRAPGADRANSLAMITDFVPSASVVHDQLHVRGGHQVDWLIDGVAVPNTNIASNVGPQFDPRDVDYLEVQRGGYSAEYGDRTYAVFNVVPRSGFERNNEAHAILSYGSHQATDDQFNFGSHSARFAYYASVSVNRSDYGLETPVPDVLHDSAHGAGAFASFIFLPNAADQFRLVASARADRYEIPNDEDLQAYGIDDRQRESDLFLNASWLRTLSPSSLLTVAPFFHTNSGDFEGGPADPIVTRDRRRSRYLGAQVTYAVTRRGNDVRAGAFGFHQRDDARLSLQSSDTAISQRDTPGGSVAAAFVEDRYDVTDRLTIRAGLRYTRFNGSLRESATTPRLGASLRVGRSAVVRASYSDVYQAPPLSTVSGPLLQFALQAGFGFLPLHGERDHQQEIGIAVPLGGWNLDVTAFRNNARNFFDHDALGNSNMFFPLTIERAHVRGAELMAQSPLLASRTRIHIAYSHQTVEGEGGITGGLTDFTPPEAGRFSLDHDQRHTLSAGVSIQFPRSAWITGNLAYGSGFLEGDGPQHLPSHWTVDAATGMPIAAWTLKLTLINATNKRYLLDETNTFGGTHWNEPRALLGQIEYRFHY